MFVARRGICRAVVARVADTPFSAPLGWRGLSDDANANAPRPTGSPSDGVRSTYKLKKYGSFIGNPNNEKRGRKKTRTELSDSEKRTRRKLKFRKSYPEHERRPFQNHVAVVFTNGATARLPFQNPAGFPVVTLQSDVHNNPQWASPDEREALEKQLADEAQQGGDDLFLKELFNSSSSQGQK